MKKRLVLLLAVVSFILEAACADAQNGQISGTIKDDSGGVIPVPPYPRRTARPACSEPRSPIRWANTAFLLCRLGATR